MYEDKTLVCKECGKEFVFTAGEQEFYAERGFQNEPLKREAESLTQALTSILRCKESLHNARPQSGSSARSSKYVRDTSS